MIFAIIAVLVLPPLIFLYLVLPGRAKKEKKERFYGKSMAHRGLYEDDQSVPENSLSAFYLAVKNGYGIELDVQLSADGRVVVFHDDTLKRACGVDKRVDELDYDDLKKLNLFGTDEHIPLFYEVLRSIGENTPLIVELKTGKRNKELCKKTYELLSAYNGTYCIESFDPFIVKWFRFHAPHIMRGQLTQTPDEFVKAKTKKAVSFILGNILFDFLTRPHFIAHRIGRRTFAVKVAEAAGAMKVSWTVRDKKDERNSDVIIFEHYRPDISFK